MEWLSKLLENLRFSVKQKDVILSCIINFFLVFLMLFICFSAFRNYDLIKETVLSLSVSLILHLAALFAILIYENTINSKYGRLPALFFLPCQALPIFIVISTLQGAEYSKEELATLFMFVMLIFYGFLIMSGLIGRIVSHATKIAVDKKRDKAKKKPGNARGDRKS